MLCVETGQLFGLGMLLFSQSVFAYCGLTAFHFTPDFQACRPGVQNPGERLPGGGWLCKLLVSCLGCGLVI